MKIGKMVLGACFALGLAGCAWNQGAMVDGLSTGYGQGIYPTPHASPTVQTLGVENPTPAMTAPPHLPPST